MNDKLILIEFIIFFIDRYNKKTINQLKKLCLVTNSNLYCEILDILIRVFVAKSYQLAAISKKSFLVYVVNSPLERGWGCVLLVVS